MVALMRLERGCRASFGSIGASFFGQSALVVSGVLSARTLGPQNRGYLALLAIWPLILVRLGGMGLPMALPYYLARSPQIRRTIVQRVAPTAALQLCALLPIHAVILAVFLTNKDPAVRFSGGLTLGVVPCSLGLDYGLAILQGRQRFGSFNLLRCLQPLLFSVALVVIVAGGQGSIVTITMALVGSLAFTSVVALLISTRRLDDVAAAQHAGPSLRQIIFFGLRGFLGSVSPVETFRLDQAVVGLLLPPAALGFYVVGLAFTNFPRFISQGIGMVAYPAIARLNGDEVPWRAIGRYTILTIALTLPVVGGLFVAAGDIMPVFFGRAYGASVVLTRILLIGAVFLAIRRVVTDGARGAGRPGAGTIAEVATWAWLVPSVPIGAMLWGIVGVAAAFSSASVLGLAVLILSLLRAARNLPSGEVRLLKAMSLQ